MLSHDTIWQAIDALAMREGLSASSLARLAGLDASIFNRSKRFQRDGRPRWPSTESIARILEATHSSPETFFVELLGERRCVVWPYKDILEQRPASDIPVLFTAEEERSHRGEPVVEESHGGVRANRAIENRNISPPRREGPVALPEAELADADLKGQEISIKAEEQVFALRLEHADFAPFFKKGAVLLLGLYCPIETGDRVVFFLWEGGRNKMRLGDVISDSNGNLRIAPLLHKGPSRPIASGNLSHVAKILWSSQ
nr:hypothetical protein [uncultured Cohaesibacter sp.]